MAVRFQGGKAVPVPGGDDQTSDVNGRLTVEYSFKGLRLGPAEAKAYVERIVAAHINEDFQAGRIRVVPGSFRHSR